MYISNNLIFVNEDAFFKTFFKVAVRSYTKNLPKESEGNIALFNFYYCVQKVFSSNLYNRNRTNHMV